MKLKYLGTAAAEGWPALFCECDNCRRAEEAGGRNFRTRSQALIDDKLLIDFPADTYFHMLIHNVPLPKLRSCLITHNHSDHFYPADLAMRKEHFAHPADSEPFTVYGTAAVGDFINSTFEAENMKNQKRVIFQEIRPFEAVEISGYQITPLKANHDPKTGPVIYIIDDGQSKLLYANDTGWFPEETWEWLEINHPVFNAVSLDCTGGNLKNLRDGHMSLDVCAEMLQRFRELGYVTDASAACVNHFSHNGKWIYDELVPIAFKCGFMVSYDGMVINIK